MEASRCAILLMCVLRSVDVARHFTRHRPRPSESRIAMGMHERHRRTVRSLDPRPPVPIPFEVRFSFNARALELGRRQVGCHRAQYMRHEPHHGRCSICGGPTGKRHFIIECDAPGSILCCRRRRAARAAVRAFPFSPCMSRRKSRCPSSGTPMPPLCPG